MLQKAKQLKLKLSRSHHVDRGCIQLEVFQARKTSAFAVSFLSQLSEIEPLTIPSVLPSPAATSVELAHSWHAKDEEREGLGTEMVVVLRKALI